MDEGGLDLIRIHATRGRHGLLIIGAAVAFAGAACTSPAASAAPSDQMMEHSAEPSDQMMEHSAEPSDQMMEHSAEPSPS
jgi:hypothetical protein